MSQRNFDKCERCRKCPAIIECVECGTAQRSLKMCYECDKSYHQMFDKESSTHVRVPIKFETRTAFEDTVKGSIIIHEKSPISQASGKSPLRRKYPEGELQSTSPLRSSKLIDNKSVTFDQREQHQQSQHFQSMSIQSQYQPQYANQSQLFIPQMSRNYKTQAAASDSLLSPRSIQHYPAQLEQQRIYSPLDQDQLFMSNNLAQTSQFVPGSIYKHQVDFQDLKSPSIASLQQQQYDLKVSEAKLRDLQLQQSYKDIAQSKLAATQQPPQSVQLEAHSDLTAYYQRMAEEYRQKYLDLEREYNQFRLQSQHDLSRSRDELQLNLTQRHTQEVDEIQRQLREIVGQKDYQISVMKQQISELEVSLTREVDQIQSLVSLQTNLERDYKNSFLEFERKQKDNEERFERQQRDHEYSLSKFERHNEQEKEAIKKDYEALLKQVRDEYQQCTFELKTLLDLKSQENQNLSTQLKELDEKHKRDRVEYDDALHRDKYTSELLAMENERLKLARVDFERERDDLINRISALESELQRHNIEQKVHKQKTKKLERIVYGKK